MSMLRDLLSLSNSGKAVANNDTPYAVIEAFFPVGAQCYATNGTITIHAYDASGKALFSIPRPKTFPVTWTICTSYEGYSMSRDIVIDVDSENKVFRSFAAVNENELKAFMKETNYCRLSNAVGDKEKFGNDYSQRTSSEPIIYISYLYSDDTKKGYAAICKTSSPPAQTTSGTDGNLAKESKKGTITIGNNTFYFYKKYYMSTGSFASIEYTTDAVAENFSTDLYIKLFSTGDGSYELRVVAASDDIAEEFENLCDIYALL